MQHSNPPISNPPALSREEQFKIMADSAPVLIWISDTEKLYYSFNEGWLKFTGRTQEEESGKGWTAGVHPDDLQYYRDSYITSFDKRKAFKIKYRLKRHDGQYRWLLDNGVPRYAADGTFAGYIGSCIDIEDIVQSEKLREKFIRHVNHELKTPLTTIKIYTQLLQVFLNDETYPKQAVFIDRIAGQVNNLNELINDLLNVSKMQQSSLQPNKKEPVDI